MVGGSGEWKDLAVWRRRKGESSRVFCGAVGRGSVRGSRGSKLLPGGPSRLSTYGLANDTCALRFLVSNLPE